MIDIEKKSPEYIVTILVTEGMRVEEATKLVDYAARPYNVGNRQEDKIFTLPKR